MSKIISVHSFRGGVGKSNLTANLAYLLFEQKKRVAIIDADIQSPGVHILFGLDKGKLKHTLNDYLWNRCPIKDVAIDVTTTVDPTATGKLFVIPSSLSASEIAKVLREGYDIDLLMTGLQQIVQDLQLDYLLIDTHPGISEKTLLSISLSDALIVILRPDQQDYLGTAVAIELAKKLEVPSIYLILNKVLSSMDSDAIKEMVENTYEEKVAAVLPLSEEMISLGSSALFCKEYPDHPITKMLKGVVQKIR